MGATEQHVTGTPTQDALSYAWMRVIIGSLAGMLVVALPLLDWLVITDHRYIVDTLGVRPSMSAYYHSAARDLFVGTLCVVGALLFTYRFGRWRDWTFYASALAGLTVLVVAFFPERREIEPGEPECGVRPRPRGCTGLQQQLGEDTVAAIHTVAAVSFVVLLLVVCVGFILHEHRPLLPVVGAMLIVLGMGWAVLGPEQLDVAGVTSLGRIYVAELAVFTGFTLSWLSGSWRMLRRRLAQYVPAFR